MNLHCDGPNTTTVHMVEYVKLHILNYKNKCVKNFYGSRRALAPFERQNRK